MTRSSRPAVVLLALVTCLVSGVVLVAEAVPAAAHAILRSIDPPDGATVASPPKVITLTFNEPVTTGLSVITVRSATGASVARGKPTAQGTTLTQSLATDLPAGAYTIAWKTVSADGHPMSGTSRFTATRPGGRTTPAATTTTSPATTTTPSAASSSNSPTDATTSSAGSAAASSSGGDGSSGALWLVGLALVIFGLLGWVRALRRRRALKRADHGRPSPTTE